MKQMMPLQCLWRCLSIDDMEGYRVCAVTYPRRNLSGIFSDPVLLPSSPRGVCHKDFLPFPTGTESASGIWAVLKARKDRESHSTKAVL